MVKILPAGANVNLNLGKDPMQRLNETLQILNTVQNIGLQYKKEQENKEKEALSALAVTSSLIAQSDDPSDISYAENIYKSIDHVGGADYDATHKAIGKSISDARSSYSQIQNIGDEVGSLMTKNIQLYDVDGNVTVNKRFSDLNQDEIISYFNQIKSKDGANGEIAKQLGKVKQLKLTLGSRFGMFESGQLKRIPNIKFKDNQGSDMSTAEFLTSLDRFENQMNIFVEAGFEDGILNEQEAIMILNGDYKNYKSKRAEKKNIFSMQAQRTNSNLNDANNKIKSIISAAQGAETASDLILNAAFTQTVLPDLKDPNVQAMYVEQFQGAPSLTEDAEYNAKLLYNDMGIRSKAEILDFYNGRKRGLEAQRNIDRKAAESWGFNFYGEPITAINLSGVQQNEQTSKTDVQQNEGTTKTGVQQNESTTKTKDFLDENNNNIPDMIERAELPVMNKKVMSQVEKGFNKFQDKTKNEIAVIKKNIFDETKKMNRLTSFNKESLVKRKNVIANKIKGLESQLNQKEKLLNNTDIAVWFDTMASKNLKKQMSTGKSNAQLVQEYWKNKNL